MPDLAEFQRSFAHALTFDEAGSLQRRGFAVYRNTVTRGIVEALRSAFPTIDLLLGPEMFTLVALDFGTVCPPASPVLSDYGADFPSFLSAQPWTGELPYLAEVARLDWLWLESFIAPDAPTGHPASDSTARVRLHPATRFIWLATPAMTIWQAHRGADPIEELMPDWRAEGALFIRPGLGVIAAPICAVRHHLLRLCQAAPTIDDCLATMRAIFPAEDAAALLRRHMSDGTLIIH